MVGIFVKSIVIRADYRKNDHLLFLVTFWDKAPKNVAFRFNLSEM